MLRRQPFRTVMTMREKMLSYLYWAIRCRQDTPSVLLVTEEFAYQTTIGYNGACCGAIAWLAAKLLIGT